MIPPPGPDLTSNSTARAQPSPMRNLGDALALAEPLRRGADSTRELVLIAFDVQLSISHRDNLLRGHPERPGGLI